MDKITKCKVCGAPAVPGLRYCYPCDDEIGEMMAEYDLHSERGETEDGGEA